MGKSKISERTSEDALHLVQNFTLFDDDFMSAVFESDPSCAEYVLSILLGRKLTVMEVQAQKEVFNLRGRSIKLDVKAVDDEDTLYNIEVQKDEGGARPKRARYNAALLDANCEDSGRYGEGLPATYVIFITEFDKYGEGLALYNAERLVSLADGRMIPFGDDLHIIYVNGAYKGDDAIGQLMHDFRTANPDEMHDSVLKEQSNYLKRNEKGVETMCKAVEEFAERRVIESKYEVAMGMLTDAVPVEKIAMYTKLPIDKILELKDQMVVV